MRFLTELQLTPLPNRKWRLDGDFVAQASNGEVVDVPKGFITDLSSIPRFLWWESTPSDYAEAGVIHDYLYAKQVNRQWADGIYREAIETLGGGRFRGNARWIALRLFGGIAYREDGHANAKP